MYKIKAGEYFACKGRDFAHVIFHDRASEDIEIKIFKLTDLFEKDFYIVFKAEEDIVIGLNPIPKDTRDYVKIFRTMKLPTTKIIPLKLLNYSRTFNIEWFLKETLTAKEKEKIIAKYISIKKENNNE